MPRTLDCRSVSCIDVKLWISKFRGNKSKSGLLEQPFLNRGTIVYFTWPEPFPRTFFDDEPGLLGRCVADFDLDL